MGKDKRKKGGKTEKKSNKRNVSAGGTWSISCNGETVEDHNFVHPMTTTPDNEKADGSSKKSESSSEIQSASPQPADIESGHTVNSYSEPNKVECETEGVKDDDVDDEPPTKKKKEKTPGIIYLSSIPDEMQYNDVLKVFSELGEVGRISLQVGGPQPHHTRKKRYAEGWVEFLDKKKAKRTVALLNNQLVGGRKKSKWYDCIWHMKYLPKFQWSHLTERLAYEQASTQQRMRTEITQARREAQHFAEQIEWKQKEIKMANKHADWKSNKQKYEYTQRVTDDEIRKRKVGSKRVAELEKSRSNVLGSLFGKRKAD